MKREPQGGSLSMELAGHMEDNNKSGGFRLLHRQRFKEYGEDTCRSFFNYLQRRGFCKVAKLAKAK